MSSNFSIKAADYRKRHRERSSNELLTLLTLLTLLILLTRRTEQGRLATLPLKAAGARPEPIPQEWTIIIAGIFHSCVHGSCSPANRGEQGEQGEPGVSTRRFWLTLLARPRRSSRGKSGS